MIIRYLDPRVLGECNHENENIYHNSIDNHVTLTYVTSISTNGNNCYYGIYCMTCCVLGSILLWIPLRVLSWGFRGSGLLVVVGVCFRVQRAGVLTLNH